MRVNVINVQFSGVSRPGTITVAPIDVIRFTRADVQGDGTVRSPLVGAWADFPQGAVGSIHVVARTDQDYVWKKVPVDGAPAGAFDALMYLSPDNKFTPVRFDGFGPDGQLLFQTDPFNVEIQIIPGTPVAVAKAQTPIVGSPSEFAAKIARVVLGSHPSGDIPVVTWFQIDTVPQGTESLHLSFVTDQEWGQGVAAWEGPKGYAFLSHIWSGHRPVLGRPEGKDIIATILRAKNPDGAVIGESRGWFSIGEVQV